MTTLSAIGGPRVRRPPVAAQAATAAIHHNPTARFAPARVGLLGGSFNPAHGGHLHVSLLALRHLGLDQVWWLVSPQNPLKPAAGMAGYAERLAWAARVARHPRLRVSDIEAALGTRYTADTLAALARRFRDTRFVWLMGADNLAEMPAWRRWTRIFDTVPIAVFDRPTYCFKGMTGRAAQRFERWRLPAWAAKGLAEAPPPAWVFLHTRLHPASASAIRAGVGTPDRGEAP